MVGWNHPRNGHEFEQIPGDSERQGNLVCYCSCSWGVGHELATGQHFYSALVASWSSLAWKHDISLNKDFGSIAILLCISPTE